MNAVHPPGAPPAISKPPALRLLPVEPYATTRTLLQRATRSVAQVVSQADLPTARACLEDGSSLDFLVTNVRLGAFNELLIGCPEAPR
jgi:hypothetical protein